MSKNIGIEEGDICNRSSCTGTIATHPAENCRCHIAPPCSSCTDPRNYCAVCGWEESEDEVIQPTYAQSTYAYAYVERPLDSTKIDYKAYSTNTGSTMIKRGVYPEGTHIDDVRKVVNGTFGGRFNYFRNGTFEFVAYTD